MIAALLGIALATQRMPLYHPPLDVVVATIALAAQAADAPMLVLWRTKAPQALPRGARTEVRCSKDGATAMVHAARLLRLVRSFGGDMDMFVGGLAALHSCREHLQYDTEVKVNRYSIYIHTHTHLYTPYSVTACLSSEASPCSRTASPPWQNEAAGCQPTRARRMRAPPPCLAGTSSTNTSYAGSGTC